MLHEIVATYTLRGWHALRRTGRRVGRRWSKGQQAVLDQLPWLARYDDEDLIQDVTREGCMDSLKVLAWRRSKLLDASVISGIIERHPECVMDMFDILGDQLGTIPGIETVWETAWKSSIQPERMGPVEVYLRHLTTSSPDPDKALARLQCGHNPWRMDVLLEYGPELVRQQGREPRQLLGALGRQAVRVAVRELNPAPLKRWLPEAQGLLSDNEAGGLKMLYDGELAPALVAWCDEWYSAKQYVRTPDIEALTLLLEAGAHVNVYDSKGLHVLERLMRDFEHKYLFCHWPEERESFNAVMNLLVWHGADWLAVGPETRRAYPKAWDALGLISQVRKQRLGVISLWGRGESAADERRRM